MWLPEAINVLSLHHRIHRTTLESKEAEIVWEKKFIIIVSSNNVVNPRQELDICDSNHSDATHTTDP